MRNYLYNSTTMKTILLLLAGGCYVFLSANAYASTDKIGGLLNEFEDANSTQRRQVANRLFGVLNRDGFFEEPYSMPNGWQMDSVCAEVWYCAGQYYFFKQEYSKGITYSSKALPLLSKGKNIEKYADCMSFLSSCYFRISDYANAIKYAKKVLELDKKSGDKSTISSDLNNIAAIYLASQRPKEALPYALEAIKNSTDADDSLRMAIQMGMASEIYESLHNSNKALEYAWKAYHIDTLQHRMDKAAIRLCQISAPLISLKRYDEAERLLSQALPELEKASNRQSYSIACNQLGNIALVHNETLKAAAYFNKALPFFRERGDFFNESKSLEGLYKALKHKDPDKAMECIERFCMLKDSIYRHDMQEAISEHNAKYKNEELILKNEYEGKLRHTTIIISVLLIILAIVTIVLLVNINRKRKQKHDAIKQAEQMRTNFFTNISHEFRTPLTVIQSAAQELIRCSPEDSTVRRNALDILRHEKGLLNLINQILDIAKMTSAIEQEAQWKHGDVVEFITMLCESYRAFVTNKGLELIYSPQQKSVQMDFIPDYMLKIMQNLITNAVKFSHADSKVLVSTRVKGQSLQIYVSDMGIGMTEEQKKNIFKPFYQASNDTHNIGTGIGLSLVKLAVDKMKGSIEVHSALGEGTVFIVTLPLSKDGEVVESTDVKQYAEVNLSDNLEDALVDLHDDDCSESDATRILIVEDTPEVALYMSRQLSPDYKYYYAANGKEGLEKAERLVPDVIITDVMMPDMDGFDMCRQVRNTELLNHIPVIMVTAKATHEDRLRGLEAGADAYLEKPFHADELNVRVEKLLEQRNLLRQKYSQEVEEEKEHEREQESSFVHDANKIFLAKVTDAVRDMLKEGKIDYDMLAYNLCLSRAQLNRKIKAITGYTTTDLILQIRISIAKHLLDSTDEPIWSIAMKCGMDNDSCFCTLFKKSTGITPLQYKNRKRS